MIYLISLLLCLVETTLFAHISYALLREKGEICPYIGYEFYETDHFWNKHGKKRESYNHFEKDKVETYTEYGLTENNTLFLTANYVAIKEAVNGNSRGFEDFEFGVKHRLFEDESQVFSLQVLAIIPSDKYKVPVRYGRYGGEVDLRHFKCWNVWNRAIWLDSALGYRFYHGFPSDQIRAEAKLGFAITSNIHIEANSYLHYGVFNGKKTSFQNQIFFNPNYRLFRQELQLIVRVARFASLTIGCFKHFWGRNVGTGGGYFGGFWLDF